MGNRLNMAERSAIIQWLALPESHNRWLAFFDGLDAASDDERAQFRAHCRALNDSPLLTDLRNQENAGVLVDSESTPMLLTFYAWLAKGVNNDDLHGFVLAEPVVRALAVTEHPARELVLVALNLLMDQASGDNSGVYYNFILDYLNVHPELNGEESIYITDTCCEVLTQDETTDGVAECAGHA